MSTAAARLLVGAPASGGGKTTFTCGLLHALVRRGLRVRACKCGPDYIDPLFHTEVIGAPSRNLDLFFSSEDQVRALVVDSAAASDIVVIEGAMGYYDGIAVSADASAWDVARTTATPAVLVVDGRGRAQSIAAEVQGFARFREPSMVAGVVLNRVTEALYPRLRDMLQAETGLPVLGYLPHLPECSLESRHLGLVTAAEVEGLRAKLDLLAETIERTVDIDALLHLAAAAPQQRAILSAGGSSPAGRASTPIIAIARDDAFCFYYADTLRLLEQLGARLAPFSPLRDVALPADASGLYLGGGYPELHARELSENTAMRAVVAAAVSAGMPTIAECGGFLYLHERLEGEDGETYPQVGVIPAHAFRTQRLGRFGYITLRAQGDGLLARAGDELRAHEFHYWDSTQPGAAFRAQKPQSARSWECCISTSTLHAGFPHLYLPAHPQAARRFVDACRAFAAGKGA
ncbi:MAG: cobyrinate a,c-diamide synthase [Coriobacteriaceae bacterium]|nr:cobyrinate a,c-diamide synthase [Coriobacteriaceae bacterium]